MVGREHRAGMFEQRLEQRARVSLRRGCLHLPKHHMGRLSFTSPICGIGETPGPGARARATALTRVAPARRSTVPHSDSVAPVV